MPVYVVTAGYVTVETERPGGGRALVDVARGTILPADVPQEQIEHELRLRTIELVREAKRPKVATPNEPEPVKDPGPEGVPAGMSVSATLTWVGSDATRAKAALAAEESAVSPRATLIDRLGKLLPAE